MHLHPPATCDLQDLKPRSKGALGPSAPSTTLSVVALRAGITGAKEDAATGTLVCAATRVSGSGFREHCWHGGLGWRPPLPTRLLEH
mmetsp:Transcript_70797/g.169495  ORF Transcript_70797/g.169495 Transcript_70797/m.169495 type:complete len:87 (+) Transcript_70797:587-847(+)